ncbi:Rieske 2Fe-2S domain-containing protein [Streptomyces sp. WM6386]|uniref:Rieske 2Fe-2S domain-containing protein n=1 Tax=Streptomyces sp. WM6386 TaxID=1415558 RepID=UPI0006969AE4|nr:Rieske 2Fe-2S domain-containing protein [Streptomyces sp. WM6386]
MTVQDHVSVPREGGPSRAPGERQTDRGFGLPVDWWPIGHASEFTGKPRPVRLGAQAVAVYRDGAGTVHAVLDRCPHRRLPLSMGRVIDEGLQCGYHGWTFDGADGQCTLIPNFKPGESPSSRIKVAAYPVSEAEGLVFLWTGDGDPESRFAHVPLLAGPASSGSAVVRGTALARAPYERISEALLLNPGVALSLGPLLGSGDEVLGPDHDSDGEGRVVTVRRDRVTLDLPRIQTFEAPLRGITTVTEIATLVTTGFTTVVAHAPRDGSVQVLAALTPTGPHRTTVRWQVRAHGNAARALLAACRPSAVGKRLTGRAGQPLEAAADAVETAFDPGLDELRALRA